MFEDLIASIRAETVRRIYTVRIQNPNEVKRERVSKNMVASFADQSVKKQPRKVVKVGRNDPCPCGSGKKFKQCCGR